MELYKGGFQNADVTQMLSAGMTFFEWYRPKTDFQIKRIHFSNNYIYCKRVVCSVLLDSVQWTKALKW